MKVTLPTVLCIIAATGVMVGAYKLGQQHSGGPKLPPQPTADKFEQKPA
jgi:hypothetical protein